LAIAGDETAKVVEFVWIDGQSSGADVHLTGFYATVSK